MKAFIFFLTIAIVIPTGAQQSITLNECYHLVSKNYPLAKQFQLYETQNKFETEAIHSTTLPQLSFDAQATYQSDVIEFPLAMSGITPLNKDQYRATLSVNQLIYNGGATTSAIDLKSTQLKTKQKQVDVSLYQLKTKINQLYFSILLNSESKLLLQAQQAQLKAKLEEVKSGIKYGVILPSSDKIIEAELLKINQRFNTLEHNLTTLIYTLSSLTNTPLSLATQFETPLITTKIKPEINRPELKLFQLKKLQIENSEHILSKQNAPKVFGFATGGYGNPGLNMLDNSFQTFYTVGVKLNWNVFDWDYNKKQRQSLAINKDIIDNETETFKLNTRIELNEHQQEINKIEQFIISDLEIIDLRKTVLKSADSQLKNGVITSSAYITELTKSYDEKNTLIIHKIQLELAKANYNITKG